MPEHSDGGLVRQARAGNRDAYGTLVTRYQGHVYGLAYSIVGDWAAAQDIAQEAFIRAYTNLAQLRDPERFPAWLRRVAFSVAMNWLKAFRPGLFEQLDGRVDLDHLEISDFHPGPAEHAERKELANAVLRAVASLPPKYRVPLTMFHLDGLSYRKVADFLDIPLGTAQSLVHRARQKLRTLLADHIMEEVEPMVQEVFNEHKLPEEFARKVLENIPPLRYEDGDCTLAGSLKACMNYLGENVSYHYVMGVTGAAFKTLWCPPWCPSSNSMGILGLPPLVHAFRALGYKHEVIARTGQPGEEESWKRRIVESIEAGRPVIAYGIIGPPDEGVVTGYEDGGAVLLGRSYFHRDEGGAYYRCENWYQECFGLTLIGEKTGAPAPKAVLADALAWAVKLAQTERAKDISGYEDTLHVNGLAAYDAWAEALGRDEDFPTSDVEKLEFRCLVSSNVCFAGLFDARRSAAAFLREMTPHAGAATSTLEEACAHYDEELAVLQTGWELLPFTWQPRERWALIADPELRATAAGMVRRARQEDEAAVACLQRVLDALNA